MIFQVVSAKSLRLSHSNSCHFCLAWSPTLEAATLPQPGQLSRALRTFHFREVRQIANVIVRSWPRTFLEGNLQCPVSVSIDW
jgi:hypothetical protein